MKTKIKYILALVIGSQLLNSCKKDLDVNFQERVLVDNYYKTPADALAALISVYDRFGYQDGGLYDKVAIMDVAGDDQLAGGGSATDINALQVISNYTLTPAIGPQTYLWNKGYAGIYRANILLSRIDAISMDATLKARYTSEAKTLRALFYFDLVRFFKNIPLLTAEVPVSEMYNVTQVPQEDVYAFIEKELVAAIPGLPNTVPAATEGGRLTKGAAQALLGKVYMWEKKYQLAADQFAIVNGPTPGQANPTYGYKLLPNFADLWKVPNKFNSESILEIVHTGASLGNWNDAGATEGNLLNIITGPRGYNPNAAAPDYYSGYSFLVFTKAFFDFIHFDPRNGATVANLDSLEKNYIIGNYDGNGPAGSGNKRPGYTPGYNNTGYFLGKFIARQSNKTTIGTNFDLNFSQDIYEIRLADTYLLEAESIMNATPGAVGTGSRAYQLLNAVRARVGLNPVAVTQDNIEKERRLELAGEGHRWLDLIRWGKAATVLASKGFVAGKNEIFPIPINELNNTKLLQSKEWGGTK
ncbi:RagB/SusD family nutrient uptake outer membrane protein [Pedobacter jeongneungensis]|uniref:RagB/SusD family nutrient uptake outer membrane protein n=1 Tax=Pedobacter jeongneungensis TaxID=947309 RepID=UPI000469EEDC|nr:RagB/SusD family nutrient uptake outer membrane protein [Pedobacter jeongneungensis]